MTNNFLVKFIWYRKRKGGNWVHSKTFGWRQPSDHIFRNDMKVFERLPHLYNYGKDIEIYPRKELDHE